MSAEKFAKRETVNDSATQPAESHPPVASADPELARLLREAQPYVWLDNAMHGRAEARDLLARIDSALSRLAGQSATEEETK
jgi:hypothetical protein